MQGRLFVISGSSGVGKGTLISLILSNNPLIKLSVSCTTRSPRPGEKEGINYFYISQEEFKKSIDNDEFLEWAVFSGNYYGTKKSYVERVLNEGKDLILEIETQGAFQVKEKIKDAVLIFILPPSMEILGQRLRGRNTEDEEKIRMRLQFAKDEIKASELFDYRFVNDNLESAAENLQAILDQERKK